MNTLELAKIYDYLKNELTPRTKGFIEKLQKEYSKEIERLNNDIKILLQENENKEKVIKAQDNTIKEVREKINNFDVFKEFTFPLMKREEENQVKSSIDFEWRKSIKEPLLKILDKVGVDKDA